MKFSPPTIGARRAIGPLERLPGNVRNAFLPHRDFEPTPTPDPSDWLFVHAEHGQTFEDFVRSQPKKPSAVRNTIYLQPLEDFETEGAPAPHELSAICVRFLFYAGRSITSIGCIETADHNTHQSVHASITALDRRCTGCAAPDLAGKCVLHCRNYDARSLSKSWNFVFGKASLGDRVGVFSFARYDPPGGGGVRRVNVIGVSTRPSIFNLHFSPFMRGGLVLMSMR
jgi:archaemetzincin